MATRRFPAPWSVEWTEFNAWLIAHYDWAVYRQAQKYADRIGNVGAVTAPNCGPMSDIPTRQKRAQ